MAHLPNLTTQEGVVAHMEGATSARDWDNRCDEIKAANGGYPSFWYPSIVMSGLANRVSARWGGDDNIRAHTL